MQIMEHFNCLAKTTNVTAGIFKCPLSFDKERVRESLNVQDIHTARLAQFVVSMGPTLSALENGSLETVRHEVDCGVAYTRGRVTGSLLSLFGVPRLPILVRSTRLVKLIMSECHCESHWASSSEGDYRLHWPSWLINFWTHPKRA